MLPNQHHDKGDFTGHAHRFQYQCAVELADHRSVHQTKRHHNQVVTKEADQRVFRAIQNKTAGHTTQENNR